MPDVDPLLAADTAIWIRDGSPYWYLSDDIQLNWAGSGGPAGAGPDQAGVNPGDVNKLKVTVRNRAPGLASGSHGARVELWVCIPGPTLAPGINSTRIINDLVAAGSLPTGGSFDYTSDWTVNSADPNQAGGHHCLIARVWDQHLTPDADPNSFHSITDDDHAAQRNITILTVSAGGKSKSSSGVQHLGGNKWSFKIGIPNPDRARARQITVRMLNDSAVDPKLQKFIQRQLATQPNRVKVTRFGGVLPSFGLQPLAGTIRTIDNTKVSVLVTTVSRASQLPVINLLPIKVGPKLTTIIPAPFNPIKQAHFDAELTVPPHALQLMDVSVDLSKTPVGGAVVTHIFQNDPPGAMVVVWVKAP